MQINKNGIAVQTQSARKKLKKERKKVENLNKQTFLTSVLKEYGWELVEK